MYWDKIISQRKDRSVVIKMDCEGAEFRIIPNLKEAGLLEKNKSNNDGMAWRSKFNNRESKIGRF